MTLIVEREKKGLKGAHDDDDDEVDTEAYGGTCEMICECLWMDSRCDLLRVKGKLGTDDHDHAKVDD